MFLALHKPKILCFGLSLGFGTTSYYNLDLFEMLNTIFLQRKKMSGSLKGSHTKSLPVYIPGKRCDPSSSLQLSENKERDILLADQDKINLLWILCRKTAIPQSIPSWTGFRLSIRNKESICKTSIGYLDCINSPATDMSTVYHILEHCMKIKEYLNLESIVCF